MYKKSRLLFFTVLFLIPLNYGCVYGQIWLDNESIFNEAEGYLLGEEYDEAIPLYQLLEKKGLTNANISYKLGLCNLKIDGKEALAIPYLEGAVVNTSRYHKGNYTDHTAPLEAILNLGIAYRLDNRLDKAVDAFLEYKDSVNGTELTQLADYYLNQIETARLF